MTDQEAAQLLKLLKQYAKDYAPSQVEWSLTLGDVISDLEMSLPSELRPGIGEAGIDTGADA